MFDSLVKADDLCPDGSPVAQRRCVGNFNTGAHWKPVVYTECGEAQKSPVTDSLKQLSMTKINETNIVDVTSSLSNLTNEPEILTSADVIYTSKVIDAIAEYSKIGAKVGDTFLRTVSSIMNVTQKTIRNGQNTFNASSRIIDAIEKFAFQLNLSDSQRSALFVQPNIALSVWEPSDNATDIVIGFQASVGLSEQYSQLKNVSEISYNMTTTSIALPESSVRNAINNNQIGPIITLHPQKTYYITPSKEKSVTFTCVASSPSHMTYEWRITYRTRTGGSTPTTINLGRGQTYHAYAVLGKNGDQLREAYSDTYSIALHVQCIASNNYGTVISEKAKMSVIDLSSFTSTGTFTRPIQGNENRMLQIYCRYRPYNGNMQVSWYKNGHEAHHRITNDEVIFISPSQFTLFISSARITDSGTYTCALTFPEVLGKPQVFGTSYNVSVAPSVSSQVPRVYRIYQSVVNRTTSTNPYMGDDVRLECWGYGTGQLNYTWSTAGGLNNKTYTTDYGRVLVIPDVQLTDQVVYTCRVESGRKVGASSYRVRSVVEKLEFTNNHGLEDQVVQVGQDVTFDCSSSASSPKWYKNGELIGKESLDYNDAKRFMWTVGNKALTIKNTMVADSAVYQCFVGNGAEIQSTSRLLVKRYKRTRIAFVVYKNSKFFISNANSSSISDSEIERLTNSRVISATLNRKKIRNLTMPVISVYKPLKPIDNTTVGNPSCDFWDFLLNDGLGGWSTDGCSYQGEIEGRIICHCDHLTNFAVLMDFYPEQSTHTLALTIITIIGLSLSIAGLGFVVLTFVIFKKLRKGRSQKTLLNLAVALLLADITILVGLDRTETYAGCVVVAVLIHYFLLVTWSWMLVESLVQYLRIIKVLGTYVPRFMLKAAIPAWGIPLLICIIVLAVDYDLYRGSEKYCWMKLQAMYYAFAIPVGLIIIINAIVFILIVKALTCDRQKGMTLTSNQSEHKVMMLHLRAIVCVFVVLGLTWVFGFLAIEDARVAFQYLFAIFNTIQGLLIFIFHNAREKHVRKAWAELCCKKRQQKQAAYKRANLHSNTNSQTNTNTRTASDSNNTLPTKIPLESSDFSSLSRINTGTYDEKL